MKRVALVLSGGGARGAYEVGILRYLRKHILQDRHGFHIHCGTSAGALNTCFLAAHAQTPAIQGEALCKVWQQLRSSHIYKGNFGAVSQFVGRTLGYTFTHLTGLSKLLRGWGQSVKPFHGILDTAPFVPFLKKVMDWDHIHTNVKKGLVDAVVVATTNIGNGKTELFVDKREDVEYTGAYRTHFGPVTWHHAMASAAIPIIFPAVRLGEYYYGDGSLRLNTPMSPAVQLGADKILIIGVRHRPTQEESGRFPLFEEGAGAPTFTHLLGKLFNSLFLDHIDYDVEQMTRINRVIEWSEQLYGQDYLDKLNQMLKEQGIRGDIANRGLKKIESFAIFPSERIGHIATEKFLSLSRTKRKLTQVERFFLKFLEMNPDADIDFMSYLMFDPEYLTALIDLGFRDAQKNEEELASFLSF